MLAGKKVLASRVPGKNFASSSVIFFDHRVNYSGHKKLEALPVFYQRKKTSTLSIFYDICTFAITFSNSEWRNFDGNYSQKYTFENNYMHLIQGRYFAKYVQRIKFSTCD